MISTLSSFAIIFTIAGFLSCADYSNANPAIASGYDPIQICIENCAQCKKMLGSYFEGPLCVDSCILNKGKSVPECEDLRSIWPFLSKL